MVKNMILLKLFIVLSNAIANIRLRDLSFVLFFSSFSSLLGQEKSKEMKQGESFFFEKKFEHALKSFQKEFKKNPSIEVKFWVAHTYSELKNYSEAKLLFLEIVNSGYLGAEMSMSLVNLGNCYREFKLIDSAYYYYDKAINDFPEMESAYFNKAQMLYAESKFEDARKNFDLAIKYNPTNWYYFQKRLEVCFATQDYNCAMNDLIKVKELNPSMDIQFNLAYCYTMLRKYKEADSIFQMIYNENDAFFLNNYGMNKYNLGLVKEGKDIIMKALRIMPDHSYIYRNLAIIAIDENNQSKACEYLNKAKSLGFEKNYGKEVVELLTKHCN